MKDSNNVYIGRKGVVFIRGKRFPEGSSPFCNPYKVDKDGTRSQVIELYRNYITNKLKDDKDLKDAFLILKGKNLGCWCYLEQCHGDVLLELIEESSKGY